MYIDDITYDPTRTQEQLKIADELYHLMSKIVDIFCKEPKLPLLIKALTTGFKMIFSRQIPQRFPSAISQFKDENNSQNLKKEVGNYKKKLQAITKKLEAVL